MFETSRRFSFQIMGYHHNSRLHIWGYSVSCLDSLILNKTKACPFMRAIKRRVYGAELIHTCIVCIYVLLRSPNSEAGFM